MPITVWLVTVIGLCFGGGRIALGLIASALGMLGLAGLKKLEERVHQDRQATLILSCVGPDPVEEEVRAQILRAGGRIICWDVTYNRKQEKPCRTLRCEVEWHGPRGDIQPPIPLDQLAQRPSIRMLRWKT